MKFALIIPARFDSTRLPGKLLMKIGGNEVLKIVYDRCKLAVNPKNIFIATADKLIIDFCIRENINYLKTPKNCKTGTDRLIFLANKYKYNFYINVQGDEIFVDPKAITKVVSLTKSNLKNNLIINCYTKIFNRKDFVSKSVPKVILDKNDNLLYMSRAPIPSSKKDNFNKSNKQVCIYGYPAQVLKKNLFNKKSKNEKFEDIEILRFLENGFKIKMIYAKGSKLAIDTHEDLINAKKILKNSRLTNI